ncbi:MAG: WD repeat-containing protein 83, partial [Paramarteilia canceri]
TLNQAKDSISSLSLSSNGFACTTADGCLFIYDLRKMQITQDKVSSGFLSGVSLFNSSALALTISSEDKVQLFDTSSGKQLKKFEAGQRFCGYKVECDVPEDGSSLCFGSADSIVYIFDVFTSSLLHKLNHKSHLDVISTVNMTRKGDFIISGGRRSVHLWQKM